MTAGSEQWEERARRARERYEDGVARLPEERDERQRQLTRMGNAAWAAGLSFLMLGRRPEAQTWLVRAAERYRESWPDAPPGSWGRPLGAMKSRLIAGDLVGAREDARWALEAGAAASESPIGRYSAVLAALMLGEDADVVALTPTLEGVDVIPPAVAASLAALGTGDGFAYEAAIRALVTDFEQRDAYLEDVPVADTVLAFQALAEERGLEVELSSDVLPQAGGRLKDQGYAAAGRLGVFLAAAARDVPAERLSVAAVDVLDEGIAKPADPGLALVELLGYVADVLTWQQDRIAAEAYLESRWDEGTGTLRVLLPAALLPLVCLVADERRAYVVVVGERAGGTEVRFGDGATGERPPAGTENVTATYRDGSGETGNLELAGLECRSPQVLFLARDPEARSRWLCLVCAACES